MPLLGTTHFLSQGKLKGACQTPGRHSILRESLGNHDYSFWSKVNQHTHTPVNAVWLVVLCSVCLNLIAIGSTQTATAIFNITAPALDLSYIAVILAHRIYKHPLKIVQGQYTLGKWAKPVNYTAIVWVCFVSVILFFPPQVPITVVNMYVSSPFHSISPASDLDPMLEPCGVSSGRQRLYIVWTNVSGTMT